MRRPTCLSEDDCNALSVLMQKGFSFHDALALVQTSANREMIAAIEKEALSGRKLNEAIEERLPASLKSYVSGFAPCMTLSESIAAANEIYRSEQALKQKLIRELVYPLLLLTGVLAGIFLFSNTILPSMVSMMGSFNADKADLMRIQKTIHVVIMVLLVISTVFMALSFYCLHPAHIVDTLKKVSLISSSSLLNQYASIIFTRYFLACSRRHVPTRAALRAVGQLKNNPLPAAVAKMMDEQLIGGERMAKAVEKACLEEKLIRFFKIAMQAGECSAMLEGYLEMAEKRAEKQVRLFSKTVQTVSYGCIGLILILVYRLLMMPMQLLKTI